jgi:hypothetical protein
MVILANAGRPLLLSDPRWLVVCGLVCVILQLVLLERSVQEFPLRRRIVVFVMGIVTVTLCVTAGAITRLATRLFLDEAPSLESMQMEAWCAIAISNLIVIAHILIAKKIASGQAMADGGKSLRKTLVYYAVCIIGWAVCFLPYLPTIELSLAKCYRATRTFPKPWNDDEVMLYISRDNNVIEMSADGSIMVVTHLRDADALARLGPSFPNEAGNVDLVLHQSPKREDLIIEHVGLAGNVDPKGGLPLNGDVAHAAYAPSMLLGTPRKYDVEVSPSGFFGVLCHWGDEKRFIRRAISTPWREPKLYNPILVSSNAILVQMNTDELYLYFPDEDVIELVAYGRGATLIKQGAASMKGK